MKMKIVYKINHAESATHLFQDSFSLFLYQKLNVPFFPLTEECLLKCFNCPGYSVHMPSKHAFCFIDCSLLPISIFIYRKKIFEYHWNFYSDFIINKIKTIMLILCPQLGLYSLYYLPVVR